MSAAAAALREAEGLLEHDRQLFETWDQRSEDSQACASRTRPLSRVCMSRPQSQHRDLLDYSDVAAGARAASVLLV